MNFDQDILSRIVFIIDGSSIFSLISTPSMILFRHLAGLGRPYFEVVMNLEHS
jgi:hypothetical protein